jgi:hypothetical protein
LHVQEDVHARDWKVPVEKSSVTLHTCSGEALRGEVFLQVATAKGRPQTVLDLLNDPTHFLAVRVQGRTQLIHKGALLWVEGTGDLAPSVEDFEPVAEAIRVDLVSGQQLEGITRIVAPPGHRRILDQLNGSEPFFPIEIEGLLRILNKSHVHHIEMCDC